MISDADDFTNPSISSNTVHPVVGGEWVGDRRLALNLELVVHRWVSNVDARRDRITVIQRPSQAIRAANGPLRDAARDDDYIARPNLVRAELSLDGARARVLE